MSTNTNEQYYNILFAKFVALESKIANGAMRTN